MTDKTTPTILPAPQIITRKLQRELMAALEFVYKHRGMSAECVAVCARTPLRHWTAVLMREHAPDADLARYFDLFLKRVERDRAEWRATHGTITVHLVGYVVETWRAPA